MDAIRDVDPLEVAEAGAGRSRNRRNRFTGSKQTITKRNYPATNGLTQPFIEISKKNPPFFLLHALQNQQGQGLRWSAVRICQDTESETHND